MSYLESYGFGGVVRLAMDVIRTRIFFPGARLIRYPVFVRGRKWIDFGSNFTAGRHLRIDALNGKDVPLIHIGKDVHINEYVHIGAQNSITIGDRVLIASKVLIIDHLHGAYGKGGLHIDPRIPPKERFESSAPIVIEEDVWLGEFVAIMPGVRVGKGSVVGALSVVTKDIPPYCVAAGNPARIIKRYNMGTEQWENV